MNYYDIALNNEINKDIENAKYYYHLSVLFGNDLGLKKLEYLEKDVVRYLNKYNKRTVNEDFLKILIYWFDIKYKTILNGFDKELSSTLVYANWTNIWFAKYNQQKRVDQELKFFEDMYNTYLNYDPTYLYEYVALIILYDQIPRNIFRNTAKAYETDHIAFKHAKFLSQFSDFLPLHVNIFITLSYCHQESLEDQKYYEHIIHKVCNKYQNSHYEIIKSLKNIFYNHFDRIKLFGRIPERNIFLNRQTSTQEKVYMDNL